jgi:rhodanese-related sulfurtransferase
MIRKVSFFVLLLAVFLTACNSTTATPSTPAAVVGKLVSVDGGTYTDVSVPELQNMLASKDFAFVNVHIPFEGDIAGTDLSIPYDQITQNLDQLPGKDDKIVLYCRSDRMSMIAAEELVKLGYTNVWNLDGGMVAWEKAGLGIQR